MIAFRKLYRPVAAVGCLLIGAGVAAAVFGASSAQAENRYPTRTVTLIAADGATALAGSRT